MFRPVLVAVLLTATLTARAGDPADPRQSVPPLLHRSVLSAPPSPAPAASDWRARNDRVREVGGWRTYLRQAQQPEAQQ